MPRTNAGMVRRTSNDLPTSMIFMTDPRTQQRAAVSEYTWAAATAPRHSRSRSPRLPRRFPWSLARGLSVLQALPLGAAPPPAGQDRVAASLARSRYAYTSTPVGSVAPRTLRTMPSVPWLPSIARCALSHGQRTRATSATSAPHILPFPVLALLKPDMHLRNGSDALFQEKRREITSNTATSTDAAAIDQSARLPPSTALIYVY